VALHVLQSVTWNPPIAPGDTGRNSLSLIRCRSRRNTVVETQSGLCHELVILACEVSHDTQPLAVSKAALVARADLVVSCILSWSCSITTADGRPLPGRVAVLCGSSKYRPFSTPEFSPCVLQSKHDRAHRACRGCCAAHLAATGDRNDRKVVVLRCFEYSILQIPNRRAAATLAYAGPPLLHPDVGFRPYTREPVVRYIREVVRWFAARARRYPPLKHTRRKRHVRSGAA